MPCRGRPSGPAFDGPLTDLVQGTEDFAVASDAYIYGYPLVTMEMTRRVITNVSKQEGTRGRWARSSSCANIPTPLSVT